MTVDNKPTSSSSSAAAEAKPSIPQTLKATSSAAAGLQSGILSTEDRNSAVPSVYDFTDYRKYLQAFFLSKKAANPAYSASSFARRAGLGANSRGYLKLVIDGKRNLTSTTIRAFGEALALSVGESIHFENLVHFNQADRPKDRKYYFERLVASQPKKKSAQMELLEAQFRYFNQWYLSAIRELIATDRFDENPSAIAKALKNRISARDASEALEDLLKMQLIARNKEGRLVQTSPVLNVPGYLNPFIVNFHLGMMEQARHAVAEEDFSERSASGVTLSCKRENLEAIRKDIDTFRDFITEKYGTSEVQPDSVLQLNIQLFQLTTLETTPHSTRPSKKKGASS